MSNKVYVEGEQVSFRNGICEVHFADDENGRTGKGLFVEKWRVHRSIPIPQSEPAQEWSPDKAYTIYEANYLAAKYGLEKGFIGDKPYWTRVEDCKEKHCRLRKPQSAEDLVKKVLNDFKSGKIPTDDIAYNILINDANLEIGFKD